MKGVLKIVGLVLILAAFAALVVTILMLLGWSLNVPDWVPFLSDLDNSEPTTEMFVDPPPGDWENYVSRTYEWEYVEGDGPFATTHSFELTLSIPEELYLYYKGLERAPTPDYSIYVTHPTDDAFIQTIADRLRDEANKKGFDSGETVEFAASFVQDSGCIAYALEGREGEYPKYPLETLWEKQGDCEDSSILLAAILQLMGYDAVLVNFPPTGDEDAGHMGVGVAGNFSGTYYRYDDTRYYYLETTDLWNLGEIDDEYRNRQATVYALDAIPMLKFYIQELPNKLFVWTISESILGGGSRDVTIMMTVRNWGTAAAENAYVRASYDGEHWFPADYEDSYFNLEAGEQISDLQIELTVPGGDNDIDVQVIHDGKVYDPAEINLEPES